jgi:hypothetical protein
MKTIDNYGDPRSDCEGKNSNSIMFETMETPTNYTILLQIIILNYDLYE